MNKNTLSKKIAYMLRHKPEEFNLVLDDDGFTMTDDVLSNLNISMEDLEEIVNTDDKNRYSFNRDKSMIRANQGHSCMVIKYESVTPPPYLYHGTKSEFMESILDKGICKLNRHHVHLSEDKETAARVAKRRKGNSFLIRLETSKMVEDGVKFYCSENGVWLVDYVDPKYIK